MCVYKFKYFGSVEGSNNESCAAIHSFMVCSNEQVTFASLDILKKHYFLFLSSRKIRGVSNRNFFRVLLYTISERNVSPGHQFPKKEMRSYFNVMY